MKENNKNEPTMRFKSCNQNIIVVNRQKKLTLNGKER